MTIIEEARKAGDVDQEDVSLVGYGQQAIRNDTAQQCAK
jgi:hypothetical protein